MNTSLTKLLGIKTPIVGAPMFGPSGGALAAAVTQAGGFGFIGAGYSFNAEVPNQLELAKKLLSVQGQDVLPIGVGFITWQLLDAGRTSPENQWTNFDLALESKVAAIWLSFGDASALISIIRQSSPGTKIFAQVHSAEEAVKAATEWRVDVVVAQGSESGGHGGAASLTTFTLVPQVIAALAPLTPKVSILAAGGVVTGRHVAAALALGADGVVVGTALLATPESLFNENQKRAVLNAKDGTATARTRVFDVMRDIDWPSEYNGRAIINKMTEREKAITPENVDSIRQEYKKAVQEGDVSRQVVFAGQGVGLVNEAKSAGEVIKQLTTEAQIEIRRLSSICYKYI